MNTIEFPINKIDTNKFQVIADLSIYAKESIVSALYRYTDRYYIHQEENNDKAIIITFESKDNHLITENDVKSFCNDLIDFQLRYYTNERFGHIRDMIVEQAFNPVNPK